MCGGCAVTGGRLDSIPVIGLILGTGLCKRADWTVRSWLISLLNIGFGPSKSSQVLRPRRIHSEVLFDGKTSTCDRVLSIQMWETKQGALQAQKGNPADTIKNDSPATCKEQVG